MVWVAPHLEPLVDKGVFDLFRFMLWSFATETRKRNGISETSRVSVRVVGDFRVGRSHPISLSNVKQFADRFAKSDCSALCGVVTANIVHALLPSITTTC
jgi:hypothetical protein